MATATVPSTKVKIGPTRLLIDGEWREAASGKRFEIVNPATEQVIARVAKADQPDVDRAVAVDSRAIIEALRNVYDAGRLGREITGR